MQERSFKESARDRHPRFEPPYSYVSEIDTAKIDIAEIGFAEQSKGVAVVHASAKRRRQHLYPGEPGRNVGRLAVSKSNDRRRRARSLPRSRPRFRPRRRRRAADRRAPFLVLPIVVAELVLLLRAHAFR